MTDFQYLYLVLVLIYLSECFFWVRRGSLILVGGERKTYRVKYPSPSIGNESGGAIFLGVLPPAGGAFVCRSFPFSLTHEAAAAIAPQSLDPVVSQREATVFRFDAVKSIRAADDQLFVDDALFMRCGEARLAAGDAGLLLKLKSKKTADRGKAIDNALSRTTAIASIISRLDDYEGASRWLRVGCFAMFWLIFFVPTLTLVRPEIVAHWPIFLGVGLICDAWIAIAFYLAHKRLFPSSVLARWKALAIMTLAPTAAIRAAHALSRDLLSGYDPLACAAVLCDDDAFGKYARRVLMDLAHPNNQCKDEEAKSIRDSFAERVRRALEPVFEHRGTDSAEILAPPVPQDPSCLVYCPRCDTQFSVAAGTCEDCGGVALLPLKGK